MSRNKLLFIGLNGYAGSGKDTVAKMMKTILSKQWESFEECKDWYFEHYTNPTQSATYDPKQEDNHTSQVFCIAYADQLKAICSTIFGIPLQRFYMNKSNAWICINDKFKYTEIKPKEENIITAEEFNVIKQNFYNNSLNVDLEYWMSLREILVYVGTYVLQSSIGKEIFVNILRNRINEELGKNKNLKYVIITDNRFAHELKYIRESNGITITIQRNTVEQLDNIAEHDLDDEENYDYIIDNSGSYDDLFKNIWNMLHDDIEFANITKDICTREDVDNYLRLIKIHNDNNKTYNIYKLCTAFPLQEICKHGELTTYLNPVGGPIIELNSPIEGTITYECPEGIVPEKIVFDNINSKYLIYVRG